MSQKTDFHANSLPKNVGFQYRNPSDFKKPVQAELDIHLYAKSLPVFFATKAARFLIHSKDHLVYHLTVTHPWESYSHYRLLPGRITLADHSGNLVEAYSLGGEISIEARDDLTTCVVSSPAPVFDLATPLSDEALLITQLEALIAMQRATWGRDDTGFEEKLVSIKPEDLFAAMLVDVEVCLAKDPLSEQDKSSHRQALMYLHQARRQMKEGHIWPAKPPTLADLLAAPDRGNDVR